MDEAKTENPPAGCFRGLFRLLGMEGKLPTPGELLLNGRARLNHGLRTAYYRDVVRPRILKTPPITTPEDAPIELHVLTSMGDWLNLIWSLKSFLHFNGTEYSLYLHEDGSLTHDALGELEMHFPNAQIIRRIEADQAIDKALEGFPKCQKLRRENMLSLKVFDFHLYGNADKFILFDSDLLFYQKVGHFIEKLHDPAYTHCTFNGDVDSAYTANPDEIKEKFGFDLLPRINSGFAVIQSKILNFEEIEEYLGLDEIIGHHWRIEQTLYAIAASRHGVELLPEEDYTVYMEPGLGGRPMRHYVGRIRHLMYSEGIARLVREGFLKNVGRP